MKTDSLFYELFKRHPESLSELAGLDADVRYVFESITVKTTEKRMDGYFRPANGGSPDIFLEVQGYDDHKIYWRLFREISTRYEQTDDERDFIAVVLFVDEKYDPDNCRITGLKPPSRLIRLYLRDCLNTIGDKACPLTVLKPLVLSDKEKLPEAVPKWKAEIDSLKLSESMNRVLIELLENAILSRFPKMTLKEVQKMIQLTPLEETVAVRQLLRMNTRKVLKEGLQKGLQKGRKEGTQQGELIGKIHATQRFMKRRLTPKKELLEQSMKELRAILKQLEAVLKTA